MDGRDGEEDVVDAPTKELRLTGELVMWENEGGFSAPCVLVDGVQIDRAILATLDRLPEHDRGGDVPDGSLGRVELIVRVLPEVA